MPYIPHAPTALNSLEDVRNWVDDELGSIALSINETDLVNLKPIARDVSKPRDGMIIYADGVNFDPGAGRGSYEYRDGWRKLAEGNSSVFINVKDDPYNAQGDDSSDDTARMQAAIDAAEAAGGGTVAFPTGIYRHTGLTIDGDCVTLLGATNPIFSSAGGTGARLLYMPTTGDHLSLGACARWSVLNLGLVGNGTPSAGAAIHSDNGVVTSWGRLDHLWIENCWNGILIEDTSAVELQFIDIQPNVGAEFGVKWTSSGSSDILYIKRCSVRPLTHSNTVVGFFIGKGTNTTIGAFSGADLCNVGWQFDDEGGQKPIIVALYNCVGEDNNSHGFWLKSVASVELTDVYANINAGHGIFVDDGAANIRINNGQVNLNDLKGIYLADGSKEVHLHGPAVQDNSQASAGTHSNVYVEPNTTNFSAVGGRYGGDAVTAGGSSTFARYGIEIGPGTSNWYRIVGVDTHGNVTGGILDGGTGLNKVLSGNI